VLLFAFVSSSLGHAAGFYTTTSGTRALGRGGAYVAGVDDLSAQFHNPAGLIRLDGTQIMLNWSAVEATASFARAPFVPDDPKLDTIEFDEVKEEGAPFGIPSLAVGTSFGLKDWVFAFGFYPPYAPHSVWPADGPQRYSLVSSVEWQAYAGPSAAHRFADWLTVGLGLQWTFLRADRKFDITWCNFESCEEDPTYDIHSSVTSLDPFTPSANLGVLIEPNDRMSIGLYVEPPIHYKSHAKLTTTIPEENPLHDLVSKSEFTDDDATLLVDFPLILKAGLSFDVSDRVELELDGGYQGWSVNQEIVLTDLDIDIPLEKSILFPKGGTATIDDDVVIVSNYVDSYSVHLGGEWAVSDPVDLRAGVFYESGAIPTEWFNVTELDADKVGVGIGGSWTVSDHFALDIGVARNQFLVSDVTDSQSAKVVLVIPPDAPEETTVQDGAYVGNGTYDIATWIGSLGATYTF
jgi:long-chain fatty acid transport protein